MLTKEEFLTKIRTTHPTYANVPDDVLFDKIIEKYPQYESQVSDRKLGAMAVENGSVDLGGATEAVQSVNESVPLQVGKGAVETVASLTTKPAGKLLEKALDVTDLGRDRWGEDFAYRLAENLQQVGQIEESEENIATKVGSGVAALPATLAGGGLAKGITKKAVGAIAPKIATAAGFVGESVGATSAFEAIEGDDITQQELGTGLLIDTAMTSLFNISPISKTAFRTIKNFTKSADDVTGLLVKSGLDNPAQNLIKELPEELQPYAQTYLKQAQERAERIVKFGDEGAEQVKYAEDLVGDDVVKFQETISDFLGTAGKQVGKEASKLSGAPAIQTAKGLDEFKEILDSLNVKLTPKGNLNKGSFVGSDIGGQKADIDMAIDLFNFLKEGEAPARDVLSKIRNIGNKLYTGKGEITSAKRLAEATRKFLRSELDNLPGEYGKYAKKYSDLLDIQEALKKTIGQEGEKAAQFTRRLFGRSKGQPKSTIEMIEEAAALYGIKEGENITGKMAIAELMDRATGTPPPQGVQGQIAEGVGKVVTGGPKAAALALADNAWKKLFNTPTKLQAMEDFLNASTDKEAVEGSLTVMDEVLNLIEDSKQYPILRSLRSVIQGQLNE